MELTHEHKVNPVTMKTRPVVEEEKPYVSARKGCKEAWQKI